MANIFLGQILLACVIVESTLLSLPLTLIGLLVISRKIGDDVIYWAFASGLILDFFTLRTLGLSSIFFLVLLFIGGRYRKKLHTSQFIYHLLFLILAIILYTVFFYRTIEILKIVFSCISGGILFIILEKIFPDSADKRLEI